MVPSIMWWRRKGVQSVVEAHFWSLTRYRIGRRFLGLDYADNVILFPAYRKKVWGGWAAVTLGTTSTGFLTNDTSAVNVLEDGHPLHWRASSKLQAFLAEEKRVWQTKVEAEMIQRVAQKANVGNEESDGHGSSSGENRNNGSREEFGVHDNEQNFHDAFTIKCTSPEFAQRHLRLSRVTTLVYKAVYFYLWGIAISIVVQAYLLFRGWLNPPAREGLKNIEAHVLHVPKLIFCLCVSCVAWAAKKMHLLLDPLLQELEKQFPQVNWTAVSPDAIVTRAKQLAGHEKNAQLTDIMVNTGNTATSKAWGLCDDEHRAWWARAFMLMLCFFSLFCLL